MTLSGKATSAGTGAYSAAHPALAYRPLGGTGLSVSQAGFGSYRVDVEVPAHRQALQRALSGGINLIDTSSNYADGRSEALIGRLLAELVGSGELAREAVVVVSKVGYLQGQNYERSQARRAAGNPFPDLVPYAEELEHCIHPDFIADQLPRSLERLGLAALDGYLLHNPEYYLSWAARAPIPLPEARREYYRRIKLAFTYLEEEVAAGRLGWYGISSNTFPVPADAPEFTSLQEVWQIAEAVAIDHHFRLIQLPFNLFETGAATERNQSGGRSVLQLAGELGLAVLVNRPLNAIQGESLTRLATVPPPNYPATADEVSTAVDTSLQVESHFQQHILPQLVIDESEKRTLLEYLSIGLMLHGRWQAFGTYHSWRDIQSQFLLPRAQNAVQFLSNLENLPPETSDWLEEYVDAANTTLAAVSAFYQQEAAARAARIQAAVADAEEAWAAPTLSQTAIRALRSTAGVSSVLVGMRQKSYVEDVLEELERPVAQERREGAWQRLQGSI